MLKNQQIRETLNRHVAFLAGKCNNREAALLCFYYEIGTRGLSPMNHCEGTVCSTKRLIIRLFQMQCWSFKGSCCAATAVPGKLPDGVQPAHGKQKRMNHLFFPPWKPKTIEFSSKDFLWSCKALLKFGSFYRDLGYFIMVTSMRRECKLNLDGPANLPCWIHQFPLEY